MPRSTPAASLATRVEQIERLDVGIGQPHRVRKRLPAVEVLALVDITRPR